jgi:hypothetical protein
VSRHITLAIAVFAVATVAVAACSKDSGGGAGSGSAIAMAGSGSAAPKKGGGFSASLSAEMAKEGATPGSAAGAIPPSTTPTPSGPGSNAGTNGGSNAGANAGSNQSAGGTTTSNQVAGGTPTSAGTKAPDTKAPDTKAPDNKAPDTKAPDTKAPDTKAAAATPAGTPAGANARPTDHRGPVSVPADLAAIKMDLEPNWDRDFDEAGTISFVLKVPGSNDTRLFSFHYGYDPSSAPSDRDAYMAWLGDQKLLNVTLNRQRGAAWYLEGTNGSGAPAFRYLVMYGGKHLVCWGTLYKDAASNPLGDLRDKVVMAAKKICETMTL